MKIVEIPSFFPPYGGEFCIEQSKALRAAGNNIAILANVQTGMRFGMKKYLTETSKCIQTDIDGIKVYRKNMRGLPMCVKLNFIRWFSDVEKMFKDYVDSNGLPDIIHAHCAKWAGYAAKHIASEYGLPFVITEHLPSMIFRDEFGEAPSDAWQIPLLKGAYTAADMVVVVSAELVDDISCYFGKDYKWTEISNTIDTDFFAYRDRKPLLGRKMRFCCLANFIPRKGYDVLFKSFDKFAACHDNVELYIAGKFTDGQECHDMIDKMRCKDKVIVCGELNKHEVRELLYESDCLVFASRNESQGLVLLEAMSTGIPVISTDCVPKNVRISEGVMLVPTDGIDRLCESMETFASGGFKVDGRRLSQIVADKVSPERIGIRLSELMRNIVNEHKRKAAE